MNDDLIKPDTNKPVVPDMDSDIPSITSEPEDIPSPKTPLSTPEAPQHVSTTSVEMSQPDVPEPPKPPVSPDSNTRVAEVSKPSAAVPSEPLMPLLASESQPDSTPKLPDDTPDPKRQRSWMRIVLIIVVALLLAAGIAYAAFAVGFSRGHTAGRNDQVAASDAVAIKVPEHATMVAQCAVGEGTQYVLPSDIPQGPIYNVWNNKVTGIEFMLAESKIAANKTLDLALKNQKYDHIDVMYEAAGHAGFTEPHYHIVLSMVSYSDEQKITCDSKNSNASHESHDMSSMGM